MSGSGKQAVLVIHGVGEQRPMATLRSFVSAVWTRDPNVHHPNGDIAVRSKRDTLTGSYELRRLATDKNARGVFTDFFELYWAHRMEGTSWEHVWAWMKTLLRRPPWRLPSHLRPAWVALVLLSLVILLFAVNAVLPEAERPVPWPRWASAAISVLFALFIGPTMLSVVGKAARYLDAAPSNIARRQEIRSQGVEILQKLHEAGYDRIVVVGHSLGSVIGYDILTHAWPRHNTTRTSKSGPNAALQALEAQAASSLDLATWRKGQRLYFDELRRTGCTWRVSDFVTLGSPLAHAETLMASSKDELDARLASRELPTCPPALEGTRFSYSDDGEDYTPHHAAVFAPTRWTNLYFPARFLLRGDFVGGPVSSVFGPGVKDVRVTTKRRFGWLSHTFYWAADGEDLHIAALRKATDLLGEEDLSLPD